MRLFCDDGGFPVIEPDGCAFSLSLWPLFKAQFEAMWTRSPDGSPFGDAWYEQVLARNPRASWRADGGEPLHWWLSGVTPEEAATVANWSGRADLPTSEEWLQADRALSALPFSAEDGAALSVLPLHPAARALARRFWGEKPPGTWGELALLRGGILEWVRWRGGSWNTTRSGFGFLGSPPKMNLSPQRSGPSRYTAGDEPSRWNGLRLCRRNG